jgi:hypothetical protein
VTWHEPPERAGPAVAQLLASGPEAMFLPLAADLVETLSVGHPLRNHFVTLTTEAIERSGLTGHPAARLAEDVFCESVFNRFVERNLLLERWDETALYLRSKVDLGAVAAVLDAVGPAVLCAFHLSHLRLVAVALLTSEQPLLVVKAGLDSRLEAAPGRNLAARVLDSHRNGAPLSMVRGLRSGRSVFLTVDSREGGGRSARFPFLQTEFEAQLGAGWAAAQAGRPLLPLTWVPDGDVLRVTPGRPIVAGPQAMPRLFGHFGSFLRTSPHLWLSWYELLEEERIGGFRHELRQVNERIATQLRALPSSPRVTGPRGPGSLH